MTRIILVLCVCLVSLCAFSQEYRTIDGSNNNKQNPTWGAAHSSLLQVTDIGFEDKISSMGGQDRPNERVVSNMLFDQDDVKPNQLGLSDYLWVFGQFLDHDISLVDESRDPIEIEIPDDDVNFTPTSVNPRSKLFLFRSEGKEGTGTSIDNPKAYNNAITSYIDGSQVYGSDEERANWLRTYQNGKLKTSEGNLLPWNTTDGEFNSNKNAQNCPFMDDARRSSDRMCVAGDSRANENPHLLSLHTIFVREHNRLCDDFLAEDPSLSDEELYLESRKHVIAYLQSIVFYEWLPSQGVTLPEYNGYNPQENASIFNVFSAAAFRMGHTLINSNLLRMDNEGNELSSGNVTLRNSYFEPTIIIRSLGIEPFLKGMGTQMQQELDCKVIDDVRNFLFGTPDQGGLDLAAINIARGRERGLPDYNTIRDNFGLPRVKDFDDITKSTSEAEAMKALYGSVDNIDPWVAMLAEYHMPDALFGELIMTIMEEQFQALRDGDRFYFENHDFTEAEIEDIKKTTLQNIIMRNTDIDIMQDNVFEAMPHQDIPTGPEVEKTQLASIVYPNPTENQFALKTYLNAASDVTVTMIDQSGRVVMIDGASLKAGENTMEFEINPGLSKGLYNVLIETEFESQIVKLFKN